MNLANLAAPSELETLYAAALWLLREERPADAMHLFRLMLLCAPSDERGWLGLGTSHERLDQEDLALKIYAVAQDASPAPRCTLARARLLRRLGRDDDAEVAFDEAEVAAAATNDDDAIGLVANARRAA